MNWEKFFASEQLVASAKRRLSERVNRVGDCLIWQGCRGSRGYGWMAVGKRNHESTHRLAWAIANNAQPPKGAHVMHACDNPACVNSNHLSVGTPQDNQRDCALKGRKNPRKGSQHGSSKYTEGQIIQAARLFSKGRTYAQISQHLGISRGALMKTLQGHRWPHIQPILRAILGRETRRVAA